MQYFDQGFALVIGVGDYTKLPRLTAPVNDANAIGAVLLDQDRCAYHPDRVIGLLGKEATRDAILAAMKRLSCETTHDSTVLIYFSGHGGRWKDWKRTTHTFLCPSDADPKMLGQTAISRDDFSEGLSAIRARKVIVLLDCCHAADTAEIKSASASDEWRWEKSMTQRDVELLAEGDGRVILASSEGDELSYASSKYSVFTKYLLEALYGDLMPREGNSIGVFDLFDYVSRRIAEAGHQQSPILHARHVSQNFPIALYMGGRKSIERQERTKTPRDEPKKQSQTPPTNTFDNHATGGNQNVFNISAPVESLTGTDIKNGLSADDMLKIFNALRPKDSSE